MEEDITLDHLKKLGKPLWCGETGHPSNHPITYNALIEFIHLLDKQNISWALWPYKDIGDTGMVCPGENNNWREIMQMLNDNWNFWDLFSQDSLITAQQYDDPYYFYKHIANASTKANEVFTQRLKDFNFEDFLNITAEFQIDRCRLNPHYKKILSDVFQAN